MVQRLSYLGKQYDKERKTKKEEMIARAKKRNQKEEEKREAKNKEVRKDRYRKNQFNAGKNKSNDD